MFKCSGCGKDEFSPIVTHDIIIKIVGGEVITEPMGINNLLEIQCTSCGMIFDIEDLR